MNKSLDIKKVEITGVVLAGGESSRMGQDKSLLVFGEQKMIQYSIDAFKPFCKEIFISSSKKKHTEFNYKTICDEYTKIGPIAGIHSALKKSNTNFIMILPCDSPMVKKEFIQFLISQIDTTTKAIVPKYKNHLEPLFAIYHKSVLPIIEDQIGIKNYKLTNLLALIGAKTIEVQDRSCFVNINTPKDYQDFLPNLTN